ncbi:MAG: hypothetical protein ACRDTH_13815 [Pseudonocardiaceae bacterium]
MSAPNSVLPRNDFLRIPVLATARPDGFKEWHHHLLQGPGWRLLINFSVTNETLGGRSPRLVPRVIVIAHDRRWTGVAEQFDETDLDISADVCTVAIGSNRMLIAPDGYQVLIDLPDRGITGALKLTPVGPPSITRVNNQPVGAGQISWLFVPRLRADGWFRLGDRHYHAERCPAYHDHNWGHFHWGDDFSWEWGSMLPTRRDDPWSLVFTRKTDRRRLRCLSQALYLWHHDELAAMFRDAAVRMRSVGLLGRRPDCTLPPVMRLVLGGESSDVPGSIEITASSSAGSVQAMFRPESYVRLAQPSELALDRAVVLSEISGAAQISGSVHGCPIEATGAGVFELLHG